MQKMRLEESGLIRTCQYSALVHSRGEIVWCCLPRFDSAPVFSTLLDSQEGGRYRIGPAGGESGSQRYVPNTNTRESTFNAATGSFKVTDSAHRFLQFGRSFRPTQLIRIVEPIEGTPCIDVTCEPRLGCSMVRPSHMQGSHHLWFEGFASQLRLTTDIPFSYLGGKRSVACGAAPSVILTHCRL